VEYERLCIVADIPAQTNVFPDCRSNPEINTFNMP
jgi:hypothetical protein